MRKLLCTGFEPFGGEARNASWEAVSRLPGQVGPFAVSKLQVPTLFGGGAEAVLAAAEAIGPEIILAVGQAAGRREITPEVVAINLREAAIPDNAGAQPQGVPVVEGGPAAYFATLPVRAMAAAIRGAGLPASLSYSAGVYVCNDLFYTLLHRCREGGPRVGFLHVPRLAGTGEGGLPPEETAAALAAAIACLGEEGP